MTTTTIRTVFEYSMMPVQNYEFTCGICGLIASRKDAGGTITMHDTLCKDCITDWLNSLPKR